MKCHPVMLIVLLGAAAQAWAHKPGVHDSPLQSFDALIGSWQCDAQQMHIGLDNFDLQYIDAHVRLQVARTAGTQNLSTEMLATSGSQEPLFTTEALITYDPQRSLFVQYETTHGGSDATLYAQGFLGSCVTWRYAASLDALRRTYSSEPADIAIEATYCLAEEDRSLHIDYTLHLAQNDPFVLFTASCDKEAVAL